MNSIYSAESGDILHLIENDKHKLKHIANFRGDKKWDIFLLMGKRMTYIDCITTDSLVKKYQVVPHH